MKRNHFFEACSLLACLTILSCANTLDSDPSVVPQNAVIRVSALPLSNTVNTQNTCPVVKWNATNEEYGVFWVETFTSGTNVNKSYIRLSRISKAGSPISESVTITEGLRIEGLTASWSDNIYSLVWTGYQDGNKEIFYSALNNDGSKILSQDNGCIRITTTTTASIKPTLVWNSGNEYGIAWQENASLYSIYFNRINLLGTKLGADVLVTDSSNDYTDPVIAWNGVSYCVAFSVVGSQRFCNFRHISASGVPSSPWNNYIVTSTDGSPFSFLWDGSAYNFTVIGDKIQNNGVIFTRVNKNKDVLIGNKRIDSSNSWFRNPQLHSTSTGFGSFWYDGRNGAQNIYFANLDSKGKRIGTDKCVISATTYNIDPAFATTWTGSGYGFVWADDQSGSNIIKFARISQDGTVL